MNPTKHVILYAEDDQDDVALVKEVSYKPLYLNPEGGNTIDKTDRQLAKVISTHIEEILG